MKIKNFFISVAAVAVMAVSAKAETLQYFTRDLLQTNEVFAGGSATTNLVYANYPIEGGSLSLNAVSPLNPYAQNVTLEIEVGQFIGTNNAVTQYATNGTLFLAPVFDDLATIRNDGAAISNLTSVAFTVPAMTNGYITRVFNGTTNSAIPLVSNTTTTLVQVSATNFLGAKSFILYGVSYAGTNQLGIKRIRAGYYTFAP